MEAVVELLRSAGFQHEGASTSTRRIFFKPGTAYQATVGHRHLRLIRIEGSRVEDIRLVASVPHENLAAVVGALRETERAA
jgi:hypothetical protein